mmetsp:Transcript_5148/g.9026  ORF Transcript_5148/g.9026 Transcript_5148/m.9026 type:complete len:276 (-) Transcript_5148:1730-2557(-)
MSIRALLRRVPRRGHLCQTLLPRFQAPHAHLREMSNLTSSESMGDGGPSPGLKFCGKGGEDVGDGSGWEREVSVLDKEEGWRRMSARLPEANVHGPNKIYSMYSSVLGGVVTDPSLFVVPIDDHIFHRGHGIFDTLNISDGNVYGLDFHLDRLMSGAKLARIDLSKAKFLGCTSDEREQKARLRAILLRTVAASGQRNHVFCRYWLSVGRGDFNITPTRCIGGCVFYVVVHERLAPKNQEESDKGFTIRENTVSIPFKDKLLATIKSTNYLVNAL